ncbi:type II toxin-antitoxin system HipA family toxin [Streptomyces sp. NBC_01242]|uniref:type II toxin-antitoxin system HipA family toxin n=1 Tax=Streptomyces sp. NBC_01242 TaxID=2903795 RepID=UPI002254CB1D|nr:type II toxin-antitoxin system HipA family toxin [Streptomyces sp. NBC_01242]MCX4798230.1 type II toxin-antitoxin system HipA family toxin [Streptomyces sp. NBC_01242]
MVRNLNPGSKSKEKAMQRDVTASVFLDDRRVGVLGYHDGNTWFDYTDLSAEHPVLGQGFERDPRKRRSGSGSVPEWFANLLPEPGSGLRHMIATELSKKKLHDFVLLSHLGEDLPGAVRVVPDVPLDGLPDHEPTSMCEHEHALRFSLAGVQPKFSMRYEGKALVLPATGSGGDWIVKLPDQRFPAVPENEFAMLKWAGRAGIDVPESHLVPGTLIRNLPEGTIGPDEHALAIRRFDRTDDGRVHQEDFAQVREVSAEAKYDKANYEGIGRVISAVCPVEDAVEYLRRLAAFTLMGNADAHLKNWTLRYPTVRQARLSPAYDLVCVTAYPKADHKLAFPLGGNTNTELITTESFRGLSPALRLSPELITDTVRETVEALTASWSGIKNDFEVPEFVAVTIDSRLASLPLVRG